MQLRMKFFTLFMCVFPVMILGNAFAQSVSIQTEKATYGISEPIPLTISFENISGDTLVISSVPFWAIARHLTVIGPDGKALSSMAEYTRGRELGLRSLIFIPPGEAHVQTVDLQDHFPEPYPFSNPHSFDSTGTYQIVWRYENAINTVSGRSLFTGSVSSDPISIEIASVSAARINTLEAELTGGREDVQLRALKTIRAARLSELLSEVEVLLNSPWEPVQYDAARTLYEMADEAYFDVYMALLDSSDPTLRGYGALSLGKLKDTRAVPELIRVSDEQLFPESYRAALKALGEIGDSRAIPVLERASVSDPSESIRTMAERFLRDLQNN